MDRRNALLGLARETLGEVTFVDDLSWDLGLAVVIEVSSSADRHFVVKGHAERSRFDLEVRAYRDWVPAIADRAASLVTSDGRRLAIVITKLVGRTMDAAYDDVTREREIYRDAGVVLRRFHDAQPPRALPNWGADRITGLERWIARAPDGLLDPGDVDFAREKVLLLSEVASPMCVPCHGDWQPRNWLVGPGGEVLTFDFERSGWQWWCHDLQRMWWAEWAGRPDLAEAHFDGYGRRPNDEDLAMLESTSAAGHITQIVWATEHHDEAFAEAGRRNLKTMRCG